MERWFYDWYKALEAVSEGVEQFLQETADDVVELAQAVVELSEAIAESAHEAIAIELEHLIDDVDDWIDTPLRGMVGFDNSSDSFDFLNPPVEPSPTHHSTCIGCRHYHGHVYGGNLLVCGMHPYGCDADTCPDWEASHSSY